MTAKSAFDQRGIEEDAYVEPSGLLDHLNLPPGFVKFVRKNQKTIQIAVVVVAAVVIVTSLYGSYRQRNIEKGAASLAVALKSGAGERQAALAGVISDYSGTPAALWARIEQAHLLKDEKKYGEAAAAYRKIRDGISAKDPLFPLLSYGIAQIEEAVGNSDQALEEFKKLEAIKGFEGSAFDGQARIYRSRGANNLALEVYQRYLSSFTGTEQNSREKLMVEEQIARLKALM